MNVEKNMKGWQLAIVAFALTLGLALPALAVSPALLHYQGFLTDMDGAPVDGEWVMSFRLYDGESATIPFFEETRTVYADSGVFSVLLGAQDANALQTEPFQDGEVWMGVEVNGADGPVELEPRQRVVSHPYALYAGHAQIAEQATNALSLGGTAAGSYVTVTQLGEMAVTLEELPALVAEFGVTEEELPALLEALGITGGGLDQDALAAWLLDNGYLPGPYFSGQYDDLLGAPDLSGVCMSPCYGDPDVAAFLETGGYLPGEELVTVDGANALAGDWDVAGNQLLNLVVHNAASDTPPEEPVAGQLWFDTTTKLLNFFDGSGWVAIGSGGGVADDLECVGCVGDDEVKFKWALSPTPGGPASNALALNCAGCVSDAQLDILYAGSDEKGGAALLANDLTCLGCVDESEAAFNWALAGAPGGVALTAELAVDATMLEGKSAADFEVAGAVADHVAAAAHLTTEQKDGLTGGGETILHTHPKDPGGGSSEAAKVRVQKGDYYIAGNKSIEEYIHVFSSSAPKVYIYLYGKTPDAMLLPNHNHGSHSHTHTSPKAYNDSSQCQKACTYGTSSTTVGNGSYTLTNISATSIPKNVRILVDGQDVTAAIGDPHSKGSPHWDAGTGTWGAGGQVWQSDRLDLSNVATWGVGEHTLELKETGNAGGRLLYYVYIVHPAGESLPLANDTCDSAQALEFANNIATISGTTEDMLGENKAIDDLAPAGCGGAGGGDVVYAITLAQRSVLQASLQAVFTGRVYFLDSPCDAQSVLACGETTALTDELDPGTYYVVVDSDSAEQKGDFILSVEITDAPLAANDACDGAQLIEPGDVAIQVTGTTQWGVDQYSGTCGGEGSADTIFTFDATDVNDDLSVTFSGGFESRLYLRAQSCTEGFQLSCSANGSLNVAGLTPGTYYLFVDGTDKPNEGDFTLNVTLQ